MACMQTCATEKHLGTEFVVGGFWYKILRVFHWFLAMIAAPPVEPQTCENASWHCVIVLIGALVIVSWCLSESFCNCYVPKGGETSCGIKSKIMRRVQEAQLSINVGESF